jgi:sirohydrochlorin ferrochelatase
MPSTAIILIDHGSRQEEAACGLSVIAQLVARKLGLAVQVAHLTAAPPTLDEAVQDAIAGGAGRIIVCPYFLAEGAHSRVDVPALVAEAARQYRQVDFQMAPLLGSDPLLADLVVKRVGPLLGQGEPV